MVSDGFFPHHNSSVHSSSDPERNAPGRHSGLNKPKLISPGGLPTLEVRLPVRRLLVSGHFMEQLVSKKPVF